MTSALHIEHLHKSFAGAPAVRNLSLTVQPGEIFGLLGPNGAGKSTTINMISGVCRIDSGQVLIFGHDNRSERRLTRRLVGVMHQEIVTDNFFTIDRALRIHSGYYGVPRDADWCELLIERLGLGPHLHKSMNKLSGGLKRRFMVAKAMIHKPRLLILDEPTAGVDVELRRTLWDFVREINAEGVTVLLTTHYLEEAEQMCERIAIMNHGDLIALEKTQQLLARIEGRYLHVTLEQPLHEVPETLADLRPALRDNGSALRLVIDAEQGAGEVLRRLGDLGMTVRDIETSRPGLEEVFLHLTGARPDNGQAGGK
ncbi:MAG: ABC transporter ATP-binding protein [Syntrophotalea acetylenica]|jgi:ABC-2 type transport system ATP-binding protein|uniref:ABC transporter ATP-binding protein n=2 Tax=Syntrophotalea acetylenica TaxID=29542 RepID=A0A1L3GJX5_SYNAC|nr:ABC transporter ATP-binding protein [Syntrophotalea acetylenica]APG26232.1 ABC transporter ATP-binding protein [Syntrophotalea acetylenica]APG45247.1 ABC transporter ATP-binding protein [Syntrophotalea acetylenica]MDD4457289.1 ABC transporter ATP-binding protein [Syntrophotalea acetylenica]MDY0261666.1 ABC transporter ATP-binding protein [Syntrophotalea acetylenica]